jgi:hypothetical protein
MTSTTRQFFDKVVIDGGLLPSIQFEVEEKTDESLLVWVHNHQGVGNIVTNSFDVSLEHGRLSFYKLGESIWNISVVEYSKENASFMIQQVVQKLNLTPSYNGFEVSKITRRIARDGSRVNWLKVRLFDLVYLRPKIDDSRFREIMLIDKKITLDSFAGLCQVKYQMNPNHLDIDKIRDLTNSPHFLAYNWNRYPIISSIDRESDHLYARFKSDITEFVNSGI